MELILFILDLLLTQYTTMYMWNNILTQIVEVNTINMPAAWGLCVIIGFIRYNGPNEKGESENLAERFLTDILATLLFLAMAVSAVWAM